MRLGLKSAALKRLASAVQLRPWPPHSKGFTSLLTKLLSPHLVRFRLLCSQGSPPAPRPEPPSDLRSHCGSTVATWSSRRNAGAALARFSDRSSTAQDRTQASA